MRFLVGDRAYLACGDKGDVINVAVFPADEDEWELFRRELTSERVADRYGDLVKGSVTRFEFSMARGLNFVMLGALDGGVSISLRADPHGKAFADLMADIVIDDGEHSEGTPSG